MVCRIGNSAPSTSRLKYKTDSQTVKLFFISLLHTFHLRNKYNLETILLNDILEKSEKTQEFLKKGQKISDSLIVESILEKIDSLFEN